LQLPACLPRARLDTPYNGFDPPPLPAQPVLAVCQSEAEVAALAGTRDHDRLIALTPQAACACELRGLEYLTLEDFFDVTAFLAADEPMLALQREWADRLDAFSWTALPELQAAGLRPAGQYIFFLKLLIDTLYRAAFGLAHMLRASDGGRVVYFERTVAGRSDETLFFDGPVSATVLTRAAEVYDVELSALAAPPKSREATGARADLRTALRRALSPRAVARLQALKQDGPRALAGTRSRSDDRPEVICHRVYDIEYAAPLVERSGYRVTELESILMRNRRRRRELRAGLGPVWPRLLRQDFFAEPFSWAGVDLMPIARSRLEHWWLEIVPAMWDATLSASSRFRRRRPKAFVVYSPVTPEQHGALSAARCAGVPTVTVQHGGFEGNCEYITYDLTDLRLADHRLAYGNATAEYLRDRASRAGLDTQVVATGSPRLDALERRPDRGREIRRILGVEAERPLVCYVPTSYQYHWYMSRGAYLGTPYFQLLTGVMAALARSGDVQVVYKPFPEQPLDPVVGLIQRRHPGIRVVRDVPFTDLLEAADACVIDIPSTALLEALLTPKPVVAYADARFVTLRAEAGELLRRRAVVAEHPDEFLAVLKDFLARGEFSELTDPDDGFLRAYGTDLGDGRSAERAAQALVAIANL
jgi:hypothetical protein